MSDIESPQNSQKISQHMHSSHTPNNSCVVRFCSVQYNNKRQSKQQHHTVPPIFVQASVALSQFIIGAPHCCCRPLFCCAILLFFVINDVFVPCISTLGLLVACVTNIDGSVFLHLPALCFFMLKIQPLTCNCPTFVVVCFGLEFLMVCLFSA